MPRTVEIKCDGCGRDLTSTGNCEDYRLALIVERIPSRGGAVTAMAVYPPISQNAYFCGLSCLKDWRP